jgi:two-component system, NtrC family, sensor kinase
MTGRQQVLREAEAVINEQDEIWPRLIRPVIQLLSAGRPISGPEIARAANVPLEQVERALASFPDAERDEQGRIVGLGLTLRPTPHRVQLEEQLQISEKMASIGLLAAGVAHEINNPLSAILHGVQNIHRRTAPDFPANQKVASEMRIDLAQVHAYLRARDIYKILDDMRDAGERSAGIVTNMLEFARSSNRAHSLIDLHAVIDHSLELSRKMLELHTTEGTLHPRIITELRQDSLPVLCSAAELQQVLLNLLRNATQALETSEFTPPNVPTIHLRLYRDGQEAVIEIEDNGPGMPENIRRHIFEPFFTTKEVGKGTGLGLSVSYFIITEHHAGTIEVESIPGRGSRFIIRLPLTETITA